MTAPSRAAEGRWARWRETVRRHDRILLWLYLGALGLALALLLLPPARARLLWGVQRVLTAWDARWTTRLERGEALVRAGRYEEAATYLSRLDRVFPARDVRHARDQERERLLVALGRSYAELDRKQRAVETFQRLVQFDPRNYRNHYALGAISNRLLAGWAPAPEARDAFLGVLALHPSHLPSLRGAMAYSAARGEFAEVVRLYEGYLAAFLRQELRVTLGDSVWLLEVPADARTHTLELRLARPPGIHGTLQLEAGGFLFALEQAALLGPLRSGRAGGAAAYRPAPPGGPTVTASLPFPAQPDGLARIRLAVRIYKPVDPTTWQMATTAYRNRLDASGLDTARALTAVLPSEAVADSVMLLPWWARRSPGIRVDDTQY